MASDAGEASVRRPQLTRRKRALFLLVLLVLMLGCVELACRGFWRLRGVPLLPGNGALYRATYQELIPLRDDPPIADDDTLDVLLLGGSVASPQWGTIGEELQSRLEDSLGRSVRVHNGAFRAHTTRDSAIKTSVLADLPYDVVVVYHAINEVRANAVPAEAFRDDYGHYEWYAHANLLLRDDPLPLRILPTVRLALLQASLRQGRELLPLTKLGPDAMRYMGPESPVRTAAPFRANLEHIADTASARGAWVVVPTFATYVPDDYSAEAFAAGELDYADHHCSIELWGPVSFVRRGVEVHNDVIRELAAAREDVISVDLDADLPRGGELFDDVCHLTPEGCAQWAERVAAAIARHLQAVR